MRSIKRVKEFYHCKAVEVLEVLLHGYSKNKITKMIFLIYA